jgi:hypothetical protein
MYRLRMLWRREYRVQYAGRKTAGLVHFLY